VALEALGTVNGSAPQTQHAISYPQHRQSPGTIPNYAKEFGITNRRIRADILSDTSGGADLAVELVLVDTVGTGRFSDMTGTAGKHELVGVTILLWIEQVGTSDGLAIILKSDRLKDSPFTAEAEMDLVGLLGVATGGGRRAGGHIDSESRRSNQEV
jgi:hypothetical protein